jgi:hypothetical protein
MFVGLKSVARLAVLAAGVSSLLVATAVASTSAKANAVCAKPSFGIRGLFLVSTTTGRVDRSFPDVRDNPSGGFAETQSIVSDGHGGWFIAGEFACVGTVRVPGIAHLRPDGRLDPSWHARVPHGTTAAGDLARWGDTLFALGGDTNSEWVGAFSVRTGARRWPLTNLKGGWVDGMAVDRTSVFLGGRPNSRIDGVVAHRGLVALNRKTGALLPWHAALPRAVTSVDSLAISGQRLFVSTMTSWGMPVYALNAHSGRLTSWRAPQIIGIVNLVTHGLVFASNPNQEFVASTRTGHAVNVFGNAYPSPFLAVSGDTLYANFGQDGPSQIQGQTRTLAAINLHTLKVTPWAPVLMPSVPDHVVLVTAMAADGSHVLLSAPGLWPARAQPLARPPALNQVLGR